MRRNDFHEYQSQLLEEYVSSLPLLPNIERRVNLTDVNAFIKRENNCRLSRSHYVTTITGVFLQQSENRIIDKKIRVLDYPGYLLTNREYDSAGFACFTAMQLDRKFIADICRYDPEDEDDELVLVGDPRSMGANIVCVRGPDYNSKYTYDQSINH
jgi:hypothetical protein